MGLKSLTNFGLTETTCSVGQNSSNIPSSPIAPVTHFGARECPQSRHCERSEAIQNLSTATVWIASLRSQ
jgi:hypothetical protein